MQSRARARNEFSGSYYGELEEPGCARPARTTRSFGADGASDGGVDSASDDGVDSQ